MDALSTLLQWSEYSGYAKHLLGFYLRTGDAKDLSCQEGQVGDRFSCSCHHFRGNSPCIFDEVGYFEEVVDDCGGIAISTGK